MPDTERIDRPPASAARPASNPSLEIGASTPVDDWFCLSWLDRSESVSTARRPVAERPTLAGYEIMRQLGQGVRGVVYLARDLKHKRRVAIKLMRESSIESDALSQLCHPNIVQMHEAGDYQGRQFFVLEYVAGPNLHQFLDGKPLLPRTAAELLESIARAVQHAHEQGTVHENLKPSNILLDSDDGVVGSEEECESPVLRSAFRIPKISDFGGARLRGLNEVAAAASRRTQLSGYMAPELIDSFAPSAPEADVYSLGAILYEMLTGRPPFNAADPAETLRLARECDPLPPRHLQPNLPRDLETMCLKCLRKGPKQRYARAGELAEDLRRFLEDRPITARRPNPISRSLQWARRKPASASLTAAVAIVVLALIAGTAMVASANRREQAGRQRAEQSRDGALAAADEMLEQIAKSPRLHQADLNDFRRSLMSKAVPHYLRFLHLTQGDPSQDAQRARALSKLGFIRLELGDLKQAIDDYAAAGAIYDSLLARSPGQIELQRRLATVSLRRGKALMQLGRAVEASTELVRGERLFHAMAADSQLSDEDSANLKDCRFQLQQFEASKSDR